MAARSQTLEKTAEPPAKATAETRSRRWLFSCGLVAMLACAGAYGVWQQVRDRVLSSSEYLIDAEQIVVTSTPPWIHADIRREVLEDPNLQGPLSLLDPQLTVRVAAAFEKHPWVWRVERVSKRFPSSVEVVLSYRRPVAMVEVEEGRKVVPVDVEGVILPCRPETTSDPADFSADEAKSYPRLGAIYSTMPNIGVRWSDPAVIGGAQIAAVLAEDWQALGFARIEPAALIYTRGGRVHSFSISTRGGTVVTWGRSPAIDTPDELSAIEKIAAIKDWMQKYGSLDAPGAPRQLAFLKDGTLGEKERPPIRTLPKSEDSSR